MTNKYAVKIVGGPGTIGAICYKGFDFNGTWFDSKEDAEEFKRMLEYINKHTTYEIIEEGENMSNLEYAVQDSEHRHPHADMIIEWAKDTSKVVEWYNDEYPYLGWKVSEDPLWLDCRKYRFQPPKPERVFPTTSLTKEQLYDSYYSKTSAGFNTSLIDVANAVIKQYILDMEKADNK